MSAELLQRTQQAVELARKAGADDVWASASQERDVTFEYRDGKLEKVEDSTARSLSLRIYSEDKYSSHSTTDLRQELIAEYREQFANPYVSAQRGYIDDVIIPSETRPRLINALLMLQNKRDHNPPKKHGNIPL